MAGIGILVVASRPRSALSTADSVFQSGTPSILETSSRLSLWLIAIDLVVRESRRVCAMALASRKSRIALSSAGANQVCQVVALLTRSLGQRGRPIRLDTFTIPLRVQPAGRINLVIS